MELSAAAITSALNVSLKAPSQMLDRALSTCPVRRSGIRLPSAYSQPHSHRTHYAKIHPQWVCSIRRAGGTPEAIVDSETGLLVDPHDVHAIADAVIRLLQNPDEARRLGENGRRRVESEFTWRASAQKFLDIAHAELRGARGRRKAS